MAGEAGSVNVRVSRQAHQQLAAIAKENGIPMQTVLDRAIETYRRQSFLQALNADFAALRAQPNDWAEEMAERSLWEQTLADGLEEG